MDPESFIINIKTKDFYEDIGDDVEKRFDTLNFECNSVECNSIEFNRPLPTGKNKSYWINEG